MTGAKAARRGLVPAALALGLPGFAQGQAPPSVTLDFPHFAGGLDNIIASEPRITYGGELTVRADQLQGNLLRQQYDATGHVRVHEADTTLTAQSLHFDGAQNLGITRNALLTQRPFTVRADQITVAPTQITADRAQFTTAPPGTRPDLEARVGELTLFPQQRNVVMRQASVYLLHTRLLTLRRVGFSFGGGSQSQRRQAVVPALGVSSRYGAYFVFGGAFSHPFRIQYRLLLPTRQPPQVRISGQQVLLRPPRPSGPVPLTSSTLLAAHDYLGALRVLATAPAGPLPPGDPLLFHSFLPEPPNIRPLDGPPARSVTAIENVDTHVEATGRRMDDLYVSRLPEVGLYASAPVSRVPDPPPVGDPAALRSSLRHLVLIANAGVALGYFEEQHPHIDGEADRLHATRQRDSVGLSTRPLLVAPNTLFLPRIEFTTNSYSGRRSSYRFLQVGAEVSHYFTPYSALNVQLLGATTGGDSPFNFDVLDTSRELDVRLQMGNRRLAAAGQMRYDLQRGGIFDYKLAIAPGLNGITPVFSYNFRSRSVGLGVEIPGLTF